MTGVGKRLYCFCHWGGKRKIDVARNVTYEGGITVAVLLTEGTTYNAFVPIVCEHLGIDPKGKALYYSAKLDKTQYICLNNDSQLKALLELNDEIADVFVAHADGILRYVFFLFIFFLSCAIHTWIWYYFFYCYSLCCHSLLQFIF